MAAEKQMRVDAATRDRLKVFKAKNPSLDTYSKAILFLVGFYEKYGPMIKQMKKKQGAMFEERAKILSGLSRTREREEKHHE